MEKREIIKPLQFFRFLCFLIIFSWHSIEHWNFLNGTYTRFAITFFVILSGYVMSYNYLDKISKSNLKEFIKFVFNKIKKFYPLFIISSILPFYWLGTIQEIIALNFEEIRRFIIYILLLQVYSINGVYSYNRVAWYLSLTVTFYIASFVIFKILYKFKDKFIYNIIIIIILIAYLFVYTNIASTFVNADYWLYNSPLRKNC